MALWENLYWEKLFIKTHCLFKKDLLRKIIRKTHLGKNLFFFLYGGLGWSLVSSGGSRVDGVVSNPLSALNVYRWRCLQSA